MSSNLENIKIKCERSPTLRSIHIPQFFFLFITRVIFVFFFFSFSVSKFNLKYKTKLQSDFFFFYLKLSRWLRYSIKIFSAEFMRYYQRCTTGTSLLCSIYVFILHTGRPTKSKTSFTKLECFLLASVREREKKKGLFFFLFLHSHKTSRSIWVNTAFPLNSYKQLLPSPKSAWDGGGGSSIFKSFFLAFEFFFSLLL